jgi:hypothetical protein
MRSVLFLALVCGCDSAGIAAYDVGGTIGDPTTELTSGTVDTPVTETITTPTTSTTSDASSSTTGSSESTGSGVTTVCYPGPLFDWSSCVDTVELAPVPADYLYPPPLNGQYLEPGRFVDLTALDPEMEIAPNFVLREIAEVWKGDFAVVQPHAIERLQAVRDLLGPIIVNSGYRSPDYNFGVGGAEWSRHMYGDAFDIVATGADLYTLADTCTAEGADYVSVYVAHVHCDWRDDPLDAVFFGAGSPLLFGGGLPLARSAVIESRAGVLTAPAEGWDEGEPLRVWMALDVQGQVIEVVEAATYLPPPAAVEVEVEVGAILWLSVLL